MVRINPLGRSVKTMFLRVQSAVATNTTRDTGWVKRPVAAKVLYGFLCVVENFKVLENASPWVGFPWVIALLYHIERKFQVPIHYTLGYRYLSPPEKMNIRVVSCQPHLNRDTLISLIPPHGPLPLPRLSTLIP